MVTMALCSKWVDFAIYGVSGLVTLQAASHLRHPDRLIPALPPQRGPDGEPAAGAQTAAGAAATEQLDGANPPEQILHIVRETLRSYEIPEAKVTTVLVEGTGFKSAGSIATEQGARVGVPVASLEAVGVETIRCSPLQLRTIDGWDSPLGQQLYASLRPSLEELRWVVRFTRISIEMATFSIENSTTKRSFRRNSQYSPISGTLFGDFNALFCTLWALLEDTFVYSFRSCVAHRLRTRSVKLMNFALKTRNCVSKMMHFAVRSHQAR